jgi:hypothetical protein
MNITELYDQIAAFAAELAEEHEAHLAGNKSAGRRARKAAGELKKLVTPYKKASVEKDKNANS